MTKTIWKWVFLEILPSFKIALWYDHSVPQYNCIILWFACRIQNQKHDEPVTIHTPKAIQLCHLNVSVVLSNMFSLNLNLKSYQTDKIKHVSQTILFLHLACIAHFYIPCVYNINSPQINFVFQIRTKQMSMSINKLFTEAPPK